MLCPYLLISINELLISIISFIDINIYGLNVKTAAHITASMAEWLRTWDTMTMFEATVCGRS